MRQGLAVALALVLCLSTGQMMAFADENGPGGYRGSR